MSEETVSYMNVVEESAPQEPITTTQTDVLPEGYLADGYYAKSDSGVSYLKPAFVGRYAKEIAAGLNGMKLTDVSKMIRTLKQAKKSTLPFEARLTAAMELLPYALSLVKNKKAPQLLVTFLQANLDAIHGNEDWSAFLRHTTAVYGFMAAQEGTENG
jgi:hypothetical protein